MLATQSFFQDNPYLPYVTATGPDGAAGTIDGDYKYHVFNATKTGSAGFVVSAAGTASTSNTVEYLVIASGGGGGSSAPVYTDASSPTTIINNATYIPPNPSGPALPGSGRDLAVSHFRNVA